MEIQTKTCINVCSNVNEWIDCMFIVDEPDVEKAKEIITQAYDEWWEDDEICNTITDWICKALRENNIEFEVYFKENEEEEENN